MFLLYLRTATSRSIKTSERNNEKQPAVHVDPQAVKAPVRCTVCIHPGYPLPGTNSEAERLHFQPGDLLSLLVVFNPPGTAIQNKIKKTFQ